MFRKAFQLSVLCALGMLALLLLPNGPLSGLILGQPQRQQQVASTAAPAAADTRKTVQITRAPVRVIKDPNSSFSAVAVDVAHNEIVLQDENLGADHGVWAHGQYAARAALTEPKRIIGGSATKVAMNCGVYVDPESGDIYNVNGDTQDWLTVLYP